MGKYFVNNSVEQMPQTSIKRCFYRKSPLQLAGNDFNQSSFVSEKSHCLLGQWRGLFVNSSQRSMEIDFTLLPEPLIHTLPSTRTGTIKTSELYSLHPLSDNWNVIIISICKTESCVNWLCSVLRWGILILFKN